MNASSKVKLTMVSLIDRTGHHRTVFVPTVYDHKGKTRMDSIKLQRLVRTVPTR